MRSADTTKHHDTCCKKEKKQSRGKSSILEIKINLAGAFLTSNGGYLPKTRSTNLSRVVIRVIRVIKVIKLITVIKVIKVI